MPQGHEAIKFLMLTSCFIQHCTVMFKKQRLINNFVYDKVGAEDYDLWLRLLFEFPKEGYRFASLKEPLCMHRAHKDQLT